MSEPYWAMITRFMTNQALVLCSLKMLLQCSWWRDPYSQLIFIHAFVLSTICFRKGHLYLFWNDWNSIKHAVIIRRTTKCTFLILEFYPISKKQHILQQKQLNKWYYFPFNHNSWYVIIQEVFLLKLVQQM